MYAIFRTLLALIHVSYTVLSAIRGCCLIVYRKLIELWHGVSPRTEVELLVREMSVIKKLPGHLVVVLGQRKGSGYTGFLDCVQIIGWCVTLGIPYVSFYDRNGLFVENEDAIRKEFTKHRPDLAEHISWSVSITPVVRNGFKPKTHVLLLSYKDVKGQIVSLARSLAEAITAGNLKPEEVNEELLGEKLQLKGIPDPDLALIYGPKFSTYGLLPWHTRTTEFLMIPPYNGLSVKEFMNLLKRHSRCEQRYGK